jgi:hypothetical protein
MSKSFDNVELPYRQGDWFAVPLEDGGYAIGIAAYLDGTGGVIGYFFGPRFGTVPSGADIPNYGPEDAIYVTMFGDLGLIQGEWPVIGQCPNSDASAWPMPIFRHYDPITGQLRLFRYSESSLATEIPVSPAGYEPEEIDKLPRAGLCGAKGVALVLAALLRGEDVWAVRPGP